MLEYPRKRGISEFTQSESVKVKLEDSQPIKKLKVKIETQNEGWQNISPAGAVKPNPNYKTVPCKNFALDGNCQFGQRCTFKHGSADNGQPLLQGLGKPSVPVNYKIVPCKSWSQVGQCSHGDRCTFMHGESDYKGGIFSKPYEKLLCNFFSKSGFCPRGGRCGFIHSAGLVQSSSGALPPIASPRPRPRAMLISNQNAPETQVSIRNNGGYLLEAPEQIRLRGFSESRFMTPSQFMSVSDIRAKPRSARIIQGMIQGGRNQLQPSPALPPNYKTVACTNFSKDGTCRFGSSCTYKHGDETVDTPRLLDRKTELRPRIPVAPRIPMALKSDSEYKSVPCMAFIQTSFCQYGEECWFIHGNEGRRLPVSLSQAIPMDIRQAIPMPLRQARPMPLRQARPMPLRSANIPEPVGPGGFTPQQNRSFGAGANIPNYKTVMCKHWEKDGKCPFNEKCTYKHGNEDSGRPI